MKFQALAFTMVILMLVVVGTLCAGSRAADRSILCLIAPSASQNGQGDSRKQEPKKKNKDSTEVASEEFSESVAERLVQQLSQGLEDHNARRMLSAFDGDSMDGFLNFQNQIAALFDRYDSFRVHFHIFETSAEGTAGVALVDLEIEEIPLSSNTPVRKNDQLRLEMERGKKGWKIVDVKPRAFFS
jgi:hypothetical protein